MTCAACEHIVEQTETVHVIRTCSCGRELHIAEPGEKGKGIRIAKGDRVVIPAGFLKLSLNPLRSRGQISRSGIDMLASELFLDGITRRRNDPWEHLREVETRTDEIVNAFPPLAGLDVNREQDAEAVLKIILEHKGTREFYAFLTGHFLASARVARQENDLDSAVWCVATAERFLSMTKFKETLEEVVWMGNAISRLRDVLSLWNTSQENDLEEYWQETFRENSFVLSQVFAEPVVFLQDKAYVGGMKLDRKDARFVDYLFAVESSRDAVLIEIKTPTMPLLSGEYRGNPQPSRDLVGAVLQVANYRRELVQEMSSLAPPGQLEAFAPRAVLIAGNGQTELVSTQRRKAFEIYRSTLRDVQLITFDELFRKVSILANLFGLTHTTSAPGPRDPA